MTNDVSLNAQDAIAAPALNIPRHIKSGTVFKGVIRQVYDGYVDVELPEGVFGSLRCCDMADARCDEQLALLALCIGSSVHVQIVSELTDGRVRVREFVG